MDTHQSIRSFLKNFEEGKYDSADVKTQCEAGWFDWFCKESSLQRKTQNLVKKLKRIVDSPLINQDTMYVFFKNNSPMRGSLYDDFRICSLTDDGDVIFTITPSSGQESMKGKASVWGRQNDFEEALVEGTWQEVVNWFKNGGVKNEL